MSSERNDYEVFDDTSYSSVPETMEEIQQARETTEALFGGEENAEQVGDLIAGFVTSYGKREDGRSLEIWLADEFRRFPDIWQGEDEIIGTAREIVLAVQENNRNKEALYAHLDMGKSKASWLANHIEHGAKAAGIFQIGAYASVIDRTLKSANDNLLNAITKKNGDINYCRNLDGFIAEQHHANTFNIEAASQNSNYQAKVLIPEPGQPYRKNSMDIGIYDGDYKLVRRYQSKYGQDAEATQNLFENGDYRGQRKLVPAEQVDQLENASHVIEIDDIKSKPLTKDEAKAIQNKAQSKDNREIKQYEWNEVNRINIAKQIGKQALIGACFAVGFQGVRIAGRRIYHKIMGRENPPLSDDLREFFQSSLKSGTHVGIQVAVTGAVVVAVKLID